jgi:hypothetical protein
MDLPEHVEQRLQFFLGNLDFAPTAPRAIQRRFNLRNRYAAPSQAVQHGRLRCPEVMKRGHRRTCRRPHDG